VLIYNYDEPRGFTHNVSARPGQADNIAPGVEKPGIVGAYDHYGFAGRP